MQISPEKVAAARACGIAFLPASSEQVRRLSMQLKVFEIDGKPHVATRNRSFFETSATLDKLIATQLEQQQLADWQAWEATGTADREIGPLPTTGAAPAAAASVRGVEDHAVSAHEQTPLEGPTSAVEATTVSACPSQQLAPPALPAGLMPAQSHAAKHQHKGRWLLAGAERRGRVAQHWSTRRNLAQRCRSHAL